MIALRRGFTLLELLIAVAVLGLVIVLLDQGVAFGLRATATQQQVQDRHGDLEAVDRALRQLIAKADPGFFPEPPPFRGTAGDVTFVSELANSPTGERERVDARLLLSGDQLRLRWTKRRHVVPFGPPPQPQDLLLLTGIKSLDIAYFNGVAWASTWQGERLPQLIRVTLRFTDDRRRWPPIEIAPSREAIGQ